LSVLVCIEIRPCTELGTKIWLNPHQDQARQGAIPALFSRMGFVRDKLPYRFYVIAGLRPDETEAAAKARFARHADVGQGDEENQLQWVPAPTRECGGCAGCGACITAIIILTVAA
jgi:hypothetical protein